MRISDWSSDVCSSDLGNAPGHAARSAGEAKVRKHALATRPGIISPPDPAGQALMIVPVLLPMSDPLIVSIGIDEGILGELDRSTRERANGYETNSATKAHTLGTIEAADQKCGG